MPVRSDLDADCRKLGCSFFAIFDARAITFDDFTSFFAAESTKKMYCFQLKLWRQSSWRLQRKSVTYQEPQSESSRSHDLTHHLLCAPGGWRPYLLSLPLGRLDQLVGTIFTMVTIGYNPVCHAYGKFKLCCVSVPLS